MSVATLETVLRSMANRIDFQPAARLIAGQSLPVSVGWEKTIRAACRAAEDSPNVGEITDSLSTSFVEHTLVGEKLVMYYAYNGLGAQAKKQIIDQAKTFALIYSVPASPYSAAYPLAVYDQKILKQLETTPPQVVDVFESNGTLTFVFCSVRAFYERVPLDTDLFEGDNKELVSEYSELIGIRAIRRQCFDQVIIDSARELIEVRVDAPDGMPTSQRVAAMQVLTHAFDNLSVWGAGFTFFTGAPFNFHTLMKALYATKGEGSVFQLGFTASTNDTSSNNGARLLRKKTVDLRIDAFHRGGAKSVTDLSPYSIGVEWKRAAKVSGPQLIIPGSAKMLYQPPITFNQLLIRNCFTASDFGFVTSKIDQHR